MHNLHLSAKGARCLLRQTVLGYYTATAGDVTIRLDISDQHPHDTFIHELTHRDLTERTMAGQLDRVLGWASAKQPGTGAVARSALDRAYSIWTSRSWTLHEATALYVAAVASRATQFAPIPLDALPPEYRKAVQLWLDLLPDPYAGPVSYIANHTIASACARAVLDAAGSAVAAVRPRTWTDFEELLSNSNADALFVSVLADLETSGDLPQMRNIVARVGAEKLGAVGTEDLDVRLTAHIETTDVSHGLDALTTELFRAIEDELETYLQTVFPQLGQYQPRAERARAIRRSPRRCSLERRPAGPVRGPASGEAGARARWADHLPSRTDRPAAARVAPSSRNRIYLQRLCGEVA